MRLCDTTKSKDYGLIERIKNQEIEIARLEKELSMLRKEKSNLERKREKIEMRAIKMIAFDNTLKNELQRKSAIETILDKDKEYNDILNKISEIESSIIELKYELDISKAELNYLLRTYEMEKNINVG